MVVKIADMNLDYYTGFSLQVFTIALTKILDQPSNRWYSGIEAQRIGPVFIPMQGVYPMGKPVAVSDTTFEAEVLKSTTPVLVDFWAEWCGPCRMVAPVVEQIAEEQGDKLKVVKMDVDNNQKVAQQLGIMSIPTLILFKDGQAAERLVGYMPKDQISKRLAPHLS
jgi:thioredoxin 1